MGGISSPPALLGLLERPSFVLSLWRHHGVLVVESLCFLHSSRPFTARWRMLAHVAGGRRSMFPLAQSLEAPISEQPLCDKQELYYQLLKPLGSLLAILGT